MQAPLQEIPQEIAGEQHEGRGIGPEQGQVSQSQGPGGQEGVVVAQQHPGVGEDAAVVPVSFPQAAEIRPNHQHDEGTQPHGNDGAQRSRIRQEHGAGHDEGSPADDAAKGKRPDIQRRQEPQPLALLQILEV